MAARWPYAPPVTFAIIVFGGIALVLVAVLAAARYSSKTGPQILDWQPTRSFEQEIELESDDVEQMIAARNERRRQRGDDEISAHEFREEVRLEEQAHRRRAASYRDDREETGEISPGR